MKKIFTLLVIVASLLIATPVYAGLPIPTTSIFKHYGADRGGTSFVLAQSYLMDTKFSSNDGTIFVADGFNRLQDALCSVPYAAYKNSPLLLYTKGITDGLHTITPSGDAQAFMVIPSTGSHYLWTTGGVNPPFNVLNSPYVPSVIQNFAGNLNSQDLAVKIANQLPAPTYLFITNEQSYADALSITPYAAYTHSPILFVNQNSVAQSVLDYVSANQATLKAIYIIGGTAVISDDVKNQFPNSIRLAGQDRYGTCLQANLTLPTVMYSKAPSISFDVMNGEDYALADGISAGANERYNAHIFWLTPGTTLPFTDQDLSNCLYPLKQMNPPVRPTNSVTVIGGSGVVSDGVAITFADMLSKLYPF